MVFRGRRTGENHEKSKLLRFLAYATDLSYYKWLMLCFRVLFDQHLNQRVKQGFSPFAGIMDELEKTKIERKLFL
jgi:hypothetical protein